MTAPQDPSQAAQNADPLQGRIIALRQQVEHRARAARTKQTLAMILGTGLTALVIVCMSAVTNLARKLDAGSLAQIGRQQVEAHLPDGRVAVEGYLRREAPELVGRALTGFVELMPRLRQMVVKDLGAKLSVINEQFEQRVVAQMTDAIGKTKAKIDQEWPDASDKEKLEKLVETVAGDFNANVRVATAALYPEYQNEMSRITSYLDELSSKDPASLTDSDRQRKEIIQILLQLIERERAN